MKMIIRSSNGDLREQEITSNMNFTPTQGEHLYFTEVQSYTFNLVSDNTGMNVYFMTNEGQRINIVFENMANLIQQNDLLDPFSIDTILGVSTNAEGDKQIHSALHNPEFESGEIVEALKAALSLDGSTFAGGAVIDDFQSMFDNMEATATGAGPSDSAFLGEEDRNQEATGNGTEDNSARPENPEDTPSTNTPPSNTPQYYTTATASLRGLDVNEDQDSSTFTLSFSTSTLAPATMVVNINGVATTYTIPTGTTSFDFDVATKDSDVYVDPDTVTVSIVSLTGGGFDAIEITNSTVTIGIADTIDDTTLTLGNVTVDEANNGTATVNGSLSADTKVELVVTLDNGATITFPAGTSAGTTVASTAFAINNDEDVYNDNSSFEVSVASTTNDPSVDNNFEKLVTTDKATVTVNDTTDTVIIRVFASDSDGNLLTDTQGNYLTANETAEGGATHYVALAFEPNTVVFNDNTLLDTQLGKVDFTFTNKTTENNDYTPQTTITSIALGTAISMDAVDDKIAENSENLEVSIGNYVTPTSGLIYEAVDVDRVVTTTITDNDIAPEAKDNTNTATETGTEFLVSEDEATDGQSATGNVITDTQADLGSNPLSITAINFNGTILNIPSNGNNITVTGDYGTLTINNSGAYTYNVNENITDSWNIGKSEIDQFTYTLSDGYNPDDTAKLSISVEGRDDAPVITSITANDRATHTIDGLIDIDGDGIADEYTPDDLTQADKGLIFAAENGDLNINMGTVSSSMSVEYNGGQASYHNAIGYYLADNKGNPIEAHIIYVEDDSFVGTQAEMLGTLNDLIGNVGFFIIPDGGDNNITTNSEITFNDQGNMIINNSVQTAFYSDNDLNSDNHDHVVATANENGGLILGFEDLSLGDKDYDDVVLTIKPCEKLSETDQILKNIELSDADDTNLENAMIVLKNYQNGDEIKYENLPNGISGISEIISGKLVISLSGSATIEQYEEVLESLTFETNSTNRDPRTFEFTVNDGDKTSNAQEITVDIGGCQLNTGDYTNTVVATDDYGYQDNPQGEFEVTAYEDGKDQSEPDVASLKDGGYVVAWTEVSGNTYKSAEVNDLNNDGDVLDNDETVWQDGLINHDVFIQRYDADGEVVGDATRVNTFVTNVNADGGRSQHDVNVVGLENGNYLVTWTSDDQYIAQDSWDNGSRYIQGQIYDVNGNPICEEFTVSRAEYDPIVALPDGGFIVTWSADARLDNSDKDGTSNNNPQDGTDNPIYSDTHDGSGFGVIAQRFDALGNEIGDRVIVNKTILDNQFDSDIVMIDDDTAIMTWQSQNGIDGNFDIHAQTLTLKDNGLVVDSTNDIIVANGSANQTNPEVTALSDGTAIITYQSNTNIMAKTVSSTGVGSEVTIATGSNPVITALATGVVIAYEDNGTIFTKTFDGTNVSDAIVVSEDATGQTLPAVTTLEDGGYAISWQDDNGISAHRYNNDGTDYHQNEFDMLEDNSLTITADRIMENDNDSEGHTFEVISVQDATNGSVTMDANGNITFTPDEDYNGPATFKYTIQDELGATDTATVYLNVKPQGEPTIFVGTMCDADIQSHDIIVNEGEEAVLAVKISGAEANSTVSLTLTDGTALVTEDYEATFSYSFDGANWTVYDSNNPISIPEGASKFAVKMDTVENTTNENDELFNLSATLSTGEIGTGTVTIIDDDTNPPIADAVLTTATLFEMGAYQGDGFNQMVNTSKLDSANAPLIHINGKGFGVVQDGNGNSTNQSTALDQNESIGMVIHNPTSQIAFDINIDDDATATGKVEFYNNQGNKVGEIDFNNLNNDGSFTQDDIQMSNGLNGNQEEFTESYDDTPFSYVVFDAMTSNGNADGGNGVYIDIKSVSDNVVDSSNLTINDSKVTAEVTTLTIDAEENDSIDLSMFTEDNSDVDGIDFTDNKNQTITVELDDIVDLTDDDNDLVIKGDNGDIINLDENEGWERSDTTTNIDGQDFTEYTNANNTTISVFIDNDLDTTGLN